MSLQRGEHFGSWMNDRCGKLTGSRMASAMAYLKPKKEGGERTDKAERKNLKIELLAERMTGDIVTKYTTARCNGVLTPNHLRSRLMRPLRAAGAGGWLRGSPEY
jgi:hypothetical protein